MGTEITCMNRNCVHYDAWREKCCRDAVVIGEGLGDVGCENYQPYWDTEEYNSVYYILIGEHGKPTYRSARYGKRLVYRGHTFYTGDRVIDENFSVTDGRTGYGIGRFATLREHFGAYLTATSGLPDVETYPLDEETRAAETVAAEPAPETTETATEETPSSGEGADKTTVSINALLESLRAQYGGESV